MVKLTPVDNDPFAAPSSSARLEPVDYDPFAGTDTTKNPTEQQAVKPKELAPASGAFPAVMDSAPATAAPQFSAPTPRPAPTASPDADPGIIAETVGDAKKGLHAGARAAKTIGYLSGVYGDVDSLADTFSKTDEIEAMYPSSSATRKAQEELGKLKDSGAGGILPSLGVYATNPRATWSTVVQSLPTMLPALGTVPLGAAVAGPTGALIGLGAASGAGDFGGQFEDYAKDKWKLKSKEDWKSFLLDDNRRWEAAQYASLHAFGVGITDMLGGKFGGKILSGVAGGLMDRGVGKVASYGAAAIPAIGADAATGAFGEAGGQLLGTGVVEGTPRINDPGAIGGEFAAGVVTGGATSSIEPIMKATGAGKQAPATPATNTDVAGAVAALQSAGPQVMDVPPEAISGSITVRDSTPDWYSTARDYIEKKGPTVASAEQWVNSLRNAPGVKQEELLDSGLTDMFMNANGRLSKQEILDHLDEKAVKLTETWRDNLSFDIDARAKEIGMAKNGGQWDTLDQGWRDQYYLEAERERLAARYERVTVPGERQGYKELTLEIPTRNIDGDNTQRDFVGGHYRQPNVVVHARVTDRVDANGAPFALVEEIQSDWHQEGKQSGYKGPQEKRLQELQNKRLTLLNEAAQMSASDVRWKEIYKELPKLQEEIATIKRNDYTAIVDGPFKQSWPELAFRKMLRYAADNNYRRLAWVTPETAAKIQGHDSVKGGMDVMYGKIIPNEAKKWAKKWGGTVGQMQIANDVNVDTPFEVRNFYNEVVGTFYDENRAMELAQEVNGTYDFAPAKNYSTVNYIDLPQPALDLIQKGMPLYSGFVDGPQANTVTMRNELVREDKRNKRLEQLGQAFDELIKGFNFKLGPIELIMQTGGVVMAPNELNVLTRFNVLGLASMYNNGRNTIHINVDAHPTYQEMWATMTHELGHIIEKRALINAKPEIKVAIEAAYQDWLAKHGHTQNAKQFINRRDNAVVAYYNTRKASDNSTLPPNDPDKRKYWSGFEEFFAEQVARWATSQAKPLTTVERFFKSLAHKIVSVLEAASKKFGLSFEPSIAINDWLNSNYATQPVAEDAMNVGKVETKKDNQRHTGPHETAEERQPETVGAREAMDKIFNGRPPKEVQVAASYADKFNKMYKYFLGIHQLAQKNPNNAGLQKYTETIAVAQLTKQQIMLRAQDVLKQWNARGGKQGDAIAGLIDDVQNMVYLTPDEVKRGVQRIPNDAEMAVLVKKHNVSREGIEVFKEIAKTFQEHLTRVKNMLIKEANKITDPVTRDAKIKAVDAYIATLRSRPYFPSMRFGDYTITVKNDAGQVIHFETFESKYRRNAAAKEIMSKNNLSEKNVQLGKLDRQVAPMVGVPAQLLDLMDKKLTLTPAQKDVLEQLKFELSPAQSFKHRFQHKNRIAGYSQDFRRAYANYFLHGANHLMKVMHADDLRAYISETREEARNTHDATKRHEIVAFMNDHLKNWLDPASDWASIRSIAFMWSLAYSPAAAAQNLTQTLMTTFPFLAAHYGDVKAAGTILKVGADWSTFYKKGKLEQLNDFEYKAITRGLRDGVVDEAGAPEMAGTAMQDNLGRGFGGNELMRGMQKFNEYGGKMFALAEQVNRRLVFRAALKLALANPGAKYSKDVVKKNQLLFNQLKTEGWEDYQAAAYVAAVDATKETQFQYGREYAPRIMRGKARTVLVFKTFIQSYIVFLSSYPKAAVRSLLIMGFLGGLMGAPGADDLKEILKAIGWQFFGKDFDLEKEARKFIVQLLGEDEMGRQGADMILHGTARQGFGIPAFMDMLGGTVGIDVPMPTLDRSKAISAGTILPIELGKMFGPPGKNQDAVIADQAQKASGAVFGAGFNIYKALTSSQISWDDTKRWERAVPRALGSLAKAYRVGTEGRERNKTGDTVVKYDVRDPEQMMEVIAMAAGYTPFRQALQWDRIMAAREAVLFIDMQRQGLMKQMGSAIQEKDPKDIAKVREAIVKFNENLAPEYRSKAITGDALTQSIQGQIRSRAAREAELSVRKSDIPVMREAQRWYPASQSTAPRKVKGEVSTP